MGDSDFIPQVLPASTPSLAHGVPTAPPGTIFVLGADGGYAVPPRRFSLYFGRGTDDVHVTVGGDDPYVSRLQGRLVCDGHDWWVRNEGRLPIQLPGDSLLLSGHELLMDPGYTPLLIGSPRRRTHLLEVHVVAPAAVDAAVGPRTPTRSPDGHDLSPVERLVLAALAQRYLRQERYPQPVSWKQVADDLNAATPGRTWTRKAAEHVVGRVRERLAATVPGVLRDDGVGEPVGNTLNHNLIQALLRSATLLPADLHLLTPPA
ncbi:FHA domain-containing protein [Actinocatenispora rupis]|nr:FHA domain-containing protein [Actinocatenispora rupis]